MKLPIDYAKEACNTMIRKYLAEDLPPKGHFHYHQGVFLSGMYQTYKLCKDESYFTYIKDWVDSIINENGDITWFDSGKLDDIQPGILLFALLNTADDMRYKKALDTLLPYIMNFPKTKEGGFWHTNELPHQMWLDGLYMAGPISVEYAVQFNKPEYVELAIEQVILME